MILPRKYKDQALEMAIDDFEKFCRFAGVDSKQLMVCIERGRGLSYQQIANRLDIPRSTVRNISKKCSVPEVSAAK